MTLLNKMQVVSLLLLQLLAADLVLAGNRPGSGGGCDGEAPRPRPNPNAGGGVVGGNPNGDVGGNPNGDVGGNPNTNATDAAGGNPNPPQNRRLSFHRDIANPAAKRFLQGNAPGDGTRPLLLSDEDIAICCTGNGDFDFLQRDLDIRPGGLSEATEAEGFRTIPGDSLWSCRRECRDPLNAFEDLEKCYAACDCRQECPTSIDFLTQDCKAACTPLPPSLEQELCFETCDRQCGERCRSTLNDYIVPLDIYAEGLEILDCRYGDLIGDAAGSCNVGKSYWEASGFACVVVEGGEFDCECINPGTCINDVYPCDYQYYCVSQSPSVVPSESPSSMPSSKPSSSPSSSPSRTPTISPSVSPTKGKAGKRNRDDDDDWDDDDRAETQNKDAKKRRNRS